MFDGIGRFFTNLIVKLCSKLPESNFDMDNLYAQIDHYLGIVNYFVPFYIFSTIFAVWATAIFGAVGVFLFLKFFNRFLHT